MVLPDPLHPAVVHLPMALVMVLPVLALLGTLAIRVQVLRPRTWAVIVLLHLTLLGSGWLALETGEEQEEKVEHVVGERYIEEHEHAGERFMVIAGLAFLVVGAGMLPGQAGAIGRIAGTVASVLVMVSGIAVGHSGGELVYGRGAGSAYARVSDGANPTRLAHRRGARSDDDSDDDSD